MKTYTIFYASLFYSDHDVDQWPGAHTFPDGAYLLMTKQKSRDWYVKLGGGFTPINLPDVPLELRTMVLLMS